MNKPTMLTIKSACHSQSNGFEESEGGFYPVLWNLLSGIQRFVCRKERFSNDVTVSKNQFFPALFPFKYVLAIWALFFLLFTWLPVDAQQQRFPKPEFESGYEQPSPITPEPRSLALEYFDVLVLLVVLSAASWLALKKRSRKGMLWLSVFSLLFFGFYRNGCVCSVGSIQNMALTFFDSGYMISVTVFLFFLLPLIFSLFFGRVFCAGACPLGAIQDLVLLKPVQLPKWLNKTLGLIPYFYLSLAILFAVTGSGFIICQYDPFVGIFRLDGPAHIIALGVAFLLIGLFVARPYCRFLCPYGVLLSWMSRFSKWHLSITPSRCIHCKLCTGACPFEAIEYPVSEEEMVKAGWGPKRFLTYALLIPVWMLLGVVAGNQAHVFLSKANPTVYLAELLIAQPELKTDAENIDIQTFLASGKSMDQLVAEAQTIRNEFKTGSMIAGGFLGLVIGLTLLNTLVYRQRRNYEPHKGNCLSCARCVDYCPVEK